MDIKEVLSQHKMWLQGNLTGVKANLCGAKNISPPPPWTIIVPDGELIVYGKLFRMKIWKNMSENGREYLRIVFDPV